MVATRLKHLVRSFNIEVPNQIPARIKLTTKPVVAGLHFLNKMKTAIALLILEKKEVIIPGRSVTDPDWWRNPPMVLRNSNKCIYQRQDTCDLLSGHRNESQSSKAGIYSDNLNHCGIFSFTLRLLHHLHPSLPIKNGGDCRCLQRGFPCGTRASVGSPVILTAFITVEEVRAKTDR